MKISLTALKRPITTFMFYLALVLFGFVSLKELSVDLLPDISYPRLSVVTQYRGVAPEEIEILITRPLEAAVSRIPGLRKVESVSRDGFSYMVLEFAWGTDMDFTLLHTREKLDSARYRLPDDCDDPTIIPRDPQSQPVMILTVSGEGSLLELKEYSEEVIKPRLEQIDGIGSAEIAGGIEREIHIEIDPELLSLYGLSLEEISHKLDGFNKNLQGGTIRKGRFKYAMRVIGEFENLDEIGKISLSHIMGKGMVRLKDIARIEDSIKEREGIAKLNGEESIGILIRKESDANTVGVTESAKRLLKDLREENERMTILVVSEQAEYIKNAISSVVKSIIFGGILAFLVLFVFLQDRKTPVIIAVVIPIAVVTTFNLLYFEDISVNIMSLGGLALGIGMLVDNSIIVSESIFRHKSLGKNGFEASYQGTKEVGMAVTASTLTTISVFVPVIYVHGVASQLFKDQALTVTFALISSLAVSLTLLPVLSSRKMKVSREEKKPKKKSILPRREPENRKNLITRIFLYPFKLWKRLFHIILNCFSWFIDFILSFFMPLFILVFYYVSLPFKPVVRKIFEFHNNIYRRFSELYHSFLLWSLNNKFEVITGSFLFLVSTFLIAIQIPRELMPKPEEKSFELHVKTPIDYSFEQTADIASWIEKKLKGKEAVETIFSQIGVISGMEGQNPDISSNSVNIYVKLKKYSYLETVINDLREKLDQFAGLKYSIAEEQSTLSELLAFSSAQIGLKVKGNDLKKLREIADNAVKGLKSIEGMADVNHSIEEGKPEFLVKIKKKSLEKYAISSEVVSRFLIDAVRGRIATQFREMEQRYNIIVRLEEEARENVKTLMDQQIKYKDTFIPLRELVDFEIIRGPKEIRRENQQREVLITANIRGKKISQVIPQIREIIENLELPPDYRVVLSGEQEEMNRSFKSLIFAFCLAAFLVYMIMAAQFESLKHPFLILFTLPMGLSGAVWALFLTGQSFNVISVIGIVVLAGIVVNDAIVKIDYTNQLRKKGVDLRQAVMVASRVRLRPVLMTSMTTIFGLFPMSLGMGKGSELQQPLAISIIGGLIFSTFLTLILIPVSYELTGRNK